MAVFAVSGCAYFKPFGVSDSLGESIGVLSVGNVELILRIGSRFACHVHRVH